MYHRKRIILLSILLILLAAGILASLLIGPVKTTFKDLWNFLIHQDPTHSVYFQLRLQWITI